MPTLKKRTNITLPDDLDFTINALSERDDVSKSAKVIELIKIALEIEEDVIWNKLAESRDVKGAKFISHDDVWK